MHQTYNFSAGPAILPKEVLKKIKKDLYSWKNLGISVMEISHRHTIFIQYVDKVKKSIKELLRIPENYSILFCHGGARGQFSAIPMNLTHPFTNPDYITSGYWSTCAAEEAKKYCSPNIINILQSNTSNKKYIMDVNTWKISPNSTYIHYCPNETISGIEIFEEPNFNNKIIIGDFSSTLFSRRINVKKYGMIYACSQKNIGPAGITIVIIRKDLLNGKNNFVPSILNFSIIEKFDSMFNTPSTFSLYVAGLVLQWIKKIGGLKEMERVNKEKATLLYEYISSTEFYENNVLPQNQSFMNVVFHIKNKKLEKKFVLYAEKFKLFGLKGHIINGGLRASIYNAMPVKGIKNLIEFMKFFEKKFG